MDRLNLPGTLDSLDEIGKYVLSAADSAGLDHKSAYRLRLAVDELATNTIVHGYDDVGLSGQLDLWAEIDDKHLTIFLEDCGGPYNPIEAPPPDALDVPLAERPIGGLGIYLAKLAVDDLRYERLNDRNLVTFVVKRPEGEEGGSDGIE